LGHTLFSFFTNRRVILRRSVSCTVKQFIVTDRIPRRRYLGECPSTDGVVVGSSIFMPAVHFFHQRASVEVSSPTAWKKGRLSSNSTWISPATFSMMSSVVTRPDVLSVLVDHDGHSGPVFLQDAWDALDRHCFRDQEAGRAERFKSGVSPAAKSSASRIWMMSRMSPLSLPHRGKRVYGLSRRAARCCSRL
jgi:hypothetical protein